MEKINLFLDDERFPAKDGWIIARSYYEAVGICVHFGLNSLNEISLDHDLGRRHTGYDFVKWLCEADMDGTYGRLSPDTVITIHSQNPVGAKNMASYLTSYFAQRIPTDTEEVAKIS